MKSALEMLSKWVIHEVGFERIEVRVAPENIASHRVAEKAGISTRWPIDSSPTHANAESFKIGGINLLRKMVCNENIVAMTTDSSIASEDPRQMLTSSRELMARVRHTERATWFPLLVLSAVTFIAVPVLRFSQRNITTCGVPTGGGYACHVYSTWGLVYWPVALVLAYFAISIFYFRKSQIRGLETRIRPFVVAGIAIAILLTGISYWTLHLPVGEHVLLGLHIRENSLGFLHRLVTPASAIGIGLLVLAWIERNRLLVLVDFVYLAFVLLPINFGWVLNQSRHWNFLPRLVIDGGLLLLFGIGFAIIQRPKGRRST